MTNSERVGLSLVLLALVGMTFILWAAANKRTDDLSARFSAAGATTVPTTTTTTPPLEAEVQALRKQVLLLQANRGLTGPEVRELVETLLPEETCVEPPCAQATPGSPPTATTAGTTTTPITTEKRRRR